MNARTLVICTVAFSSLSVAQGDSRLDEVLARANASRGDRADFKSIVADLGAMVRAADRQRVTQLAERLRASHSELALLEGFAERGRTGSFFELPAEILRGLQDMPADESLARAEEAKANELRSRFAIERQKALRRRETQSRPSEVTQAARGSRGAEAALAVDLDLPRPPAQAMPEAPTMRAGADHRGEGRALFLNGDWPGALIAFERIPEAERGADVLYRMARCHDLLDNFDAARKGYDLVIQRHPEGHWKDSAVFQLDLLKQRERVRQVIKGQEGRP